MPRTTRTKLVNANTTNSLRVTVPVHIIEMLELQKGDQVEWVIKPNGKKFDVRLKFVKGDI